MTKSILHYFIVIVIVALLSSCFISATLISNSLLATTKQDMLYSLKLIDYAIDYQKPLEEQIEKLNPLAYSDQTRISVIDIQGNVVADTVSESISENHLARQEVQEAIKYKEGYAQNGVLKQRMKICFMLLFLIRTILFVCQYPIMD